MISPCRVQVTGTDHVTGVLSKCWYVERRIACDNCNYPASEAMFSSSEEYEASFGSVDMACVKNRTKGCPDDETCCLGRTE